MATIPTVVDDALVDVPWGNAVAAELNTRCVKVDGTPPVTSLTVSTGNITVNTGHIYTTTGSHIAGVIPSATADGSIIRRDGLIMSTVTSGTADSIPNLVLQRTGTGPQAVGGRFIELRRANTADVIGRVEIQTGGSTVLWLTSSDRRLKNDHGPIVDAVTRLDELVPRRFSWIADPNGVEQDGFFADEVTPVVPEAVSGEPDATDPDSGRIVAQALDMGRLVPLLVAAVQELSARLAVLEGG